MIRTLGANAAIARNLIAAGLIIAALTGCGGSSQPSASKTTTRTITAPAANSVPSKSEFIAQADAICKTAGAKLKPQQSTVNDALTADQTSDTAANRQALANAISSTVAIASPLLDQLRGLQVPTGDRVVVAKYLAGVAGQISLYQQLVAAIEDDNASAVRTISQQIEQGKASVDGLAQGYGFKVCGSGS